MGGGSRAAYEASEKAATVYNQTVTKQPALAVLPESGGAKAYADWIRNCILDIVLLHQF